MIKPFFRLIFRAKGWKLDQSNLPDTKKYVLIMAPHTSYWDFVYGIAALSMLGIPGKVAAKKEIMWFPMNLILKPVGIIPIDRKPKEGGEKMSLVDAMTAELKKAKELIMVITPEGTRARREQWRTGFYHVALNAEVPIVFTFMDYKYKRAGIHGYIYPTGDFEADMVKIMEYYKDINAKYPELFALHRPKAG